MKKLKFSAACLILSGSIICSSCIGSFGLWSSLKDWNNNIGNKFVNEIVFLAFHIVPVYEVAYLADVIVLNSIEFRIFYFLSARWSVLYGIYQQIRKAV
jgi:hypothetical protein